MSDNGYGLHCKITLDCAGAPKIYILNTSGSFSDPTNWQDSSEPYDPVSSLYPTRSPGPGDDVSISGLPLGTLTPTMGPPVSDGEIGDIYGYYRNGSFAGYSNAPVNITGVAGTIQSLTAGGAGTMGLGDLTVTSSALLAGADSGPVYSWQSGGTLADAPVVPTGQGSGIFNVSGGSITTPLLQIISTGGNAADGSGLAPTGSAVDISGTALKADILQILPSGLYSIGYNGPPSTDNSYTAPVTVTGGSINAKTELDIVAADAATTPVLNGVTDLVLSGTTVNTGYLQVGIRGDIVSRGALVSSAAVSGTGGQLDLTNGSKVNVTGDVLVGDAAMGVVNVTSGATVTNTGNAFIGRAPAPDPTVTAASTVTVSGSGSTWTTLGALQVGAQTKGMLTVQNGATVTTGGLFLVGYQGDGKALVTGGATVTAGTLTATTNASLGLAYDPGVTASLTVDGSGTKVDSLQSATIGFDGTGTLTVSNGASFSVEGEHFRIGRFADGTGAILLMGSGSTLTVKNALFSIGDGGNGFVNASNGALLTTDNVTIGNEASATGTLRLNGVASGTSLGQTVVGGLGDGTLIISGGSSVTLSSLIIGDLPSSTGIVNLMDAGSALKLQGANATLEIGKGGQGTLDVSNGAALDLSSRPSLTIGDEAGATGTLAVDSRAGPSKLSLGKNLVIGNGGSGFLLVDGAGDAPLTVAPGRIIFGSQEGSHGTFFINNANVSMADNDLNVGESGSGEIQVQEGATLTAGDVSLGTSSTGVGNVSVSNGGQLVVRSLDVGASGTGSGAVNIGTGGTLTVETDLAIGGEGRGSLVSAGTVTAATVKIVSDSAKRAEADISGPTSTLKTTDLQVFTTSHGATSMLSIDNGAKVSSATLEVGGSNTSTVAAANAFLTVDGTGSSVTFDAMLISGGGSVAATGGGTIKGGGSETAITLEEGGQLSLKDSTLTAGGVSSHGMVDVSGRSTFTASQFTSDGSDITIEDSSSIFLDNITLNTAEHSGSLDVTDSGVLTVKQAMTVNGPVFVELEDSSETTVESLTNSGGMIRLTESAILNIVSALSMSSGSIDLSGSSNLDFSQGGTLQLSGGTIGVHGNASITGAARLTLMGGTLALDGAAHASVTSSISTYRASTIDVSGGGIITIGSSIGGQTPTGIAIGSKTYANSYIAVGSGGTLDGTGTIYGNVLVVGGTSNIQYGILHPGHSPGTLTVNGDYAQGSYGELLISIGQNDYSKLVVNGTATFDGGILRLQDYQDAQPVLGQTYTFVQATGGVSGHVDQVVSDFPFLTVSPTINGNSFKGTVVHTPNSFDRAAQTANQRGVATSLDQFVSGTPTGKGMDFANALVKLTAAQAPAAFDALSGEAHASAVTAGIEGTRLERDAIFDRLDTAARESGPALGAVAPFGALTPALPAGAQGYAPVHKGYDVPAAAPVPASPAYTAWGTGFGDFGSNGGDHNAARLDRSMGGFLLGIDTRVDWHNLSNWHIGVAGGYTSDDLTVGKRGSSGTFETYYGGLYAGAQYGAIDIKLGALGGGTSTDMRRNIAFPGFTDLAKASYGGIIAQGFGEVGYRIGIDQGFVEPLVQGAAIHIGQDAFREKGGVAALVGFSHDTDVETLTPGIRTETVVTVAGLPLIARGFLGWRHAFGDIDPHARLAFEAGGPAFTVAGAPIDRDAVAAEAGIAYRASANLTLGISYDGQAGNHASDNAVKGSMEYRF